MNHGIQGMTNPSNVMTYTVMMPGIPLQDMISTIGMLLGSYGVCHQLPINNMSEQGLTTGDPFADQLIVAKYMQLKSILIDLSREYTKVVATSTMMGQSLVLTFTCY